MNRSHLSHLGPPNLKIGPLAVWVHGYERDETDNNSDANWLRVTAHCGASGASVEVSGGILTTGELAGLRDDLVVLHQALSGEANLEPIEPGFAVHIKAERLGHLQCVVTITPDYMSQAHSFSAQLDQSHLPAVIDQLGALLQQWPVRDVE